MLKSGQSNGGFFLVFFPFFSFPFIFLFAPHSLRQGKLRVGTHAQSGKEYKMELTNLVISQLLRRFQNKACSKGGRFTGLKTE